MMATTHMFVGMAIALAATSLYPEYTPLLLLSGALGGLLPDLDLAAVHRRTLHFPIYYSVMAIVLAGFSALWMSIWTLSITVVAIAAAVHSISDIFGGSAEPRPWEQNCDRAVYNHLHQRWESALRVIRYDGSPEDLAVIVLLAIPVYAAAPKTFRVVIVTLLVLSIVYTVFRKPIGDFAAKTNL